MGDSKAGSGQRAGTWVFHFPDSVFALFPSVVPSTECLRIREELGRTSKIFDLINKNDSVDGEVRKNRFLWEERNRHLSFRKVSYPRENVSETVVYTSLGFREWTRLDIESLRFIVYSESKSLSHVRLMSYSMNCRPPGSSVHRILQARTLECLPLPSVGNLPDPGIKSSSPAF